MKDKNNLGEVEDASDDLPAPDYEEDVAQRRYQDEEGEEEMGSGSGEKEGPGKPGDKPGEGPGKPGDKPGEGEGDQQGETSLVGKKVRITEGPDAGKEGTIKQVLPNGDIIIE
jgi:transcription antitermination factor NusG